MNYETRVVAFIDLLGFRAKLEETVDRDNTDNESRIDEIVAAYESIRDIWDLDGVPEEFESPTGESRVVSIFSDAIAVSFLAEHREQIPFTLLDIKILVMRLIYRGILCRGAVTFGKLIHNDRFLFGPALIEAHLLESRAAHYPRIILDRNVIDLASRSAVESVHSGVKKDLLDTVLVRDSDGMYYIDYFSKAESSLDDPLYDLPEYIDNLGALIRRGLMGSSHPSKADVRVKYLWMRERYNKMVDRVKTPTNISWLRQEGEDDIADFYENLKKVSPKRR